MILTAAVCVLSFSDPAAAQQIAFKPFMLLVTRLTPPPRTLSADALTEGTFQKLRPCFDTTSYQVIKVLDTTQAVSMSNHKRDIIISSDPTDFFHKGENSDTLVVWVTFRTGLSFGRIIIPYDPSRPASMPEAAAHKINQFLRAEFLGEVYFEGGPSGLAIEVVDNHTLSPPKFVLLPVGSFFIESSFPGFQNRRDTLTVRRGDVIRKRILLMPK